MSMYVVTLTYLVGVEADSVKEAEEIAKTLIEDGQWDPNDIETELWEEKNK